MQLAESSPMVQTTSTLETRAIPDSTLGQVHADNPRMKARNVDVFYADKHAIDNISLDIGSGQVISVHRPVRLW